MGHAYAHVQLYDIGRLNYIRGYLRTGNNLVIRTLFYTIDPYRRQPILLCKRNFFPSFLYVLFSAVICFSEIVLIFSNAYFSKRYAGLLLVCFYVVYRINQKIDTCVTIYIF